MRFWGITGTNGKTTTAWVLAEFMKAAYITTVEVNTLRRRFYTGYTTPPEKMLREIYAEMEEAGAKDCVMEVSSHAIAQNRVGFGSTTVFSGGAFTNISEDHLDYHKTMDEYFRVKLDFARRIAEGFGAPPMSAGRRDFPPYVVCMDGDGATRMLAEVGRLPLNVLPVTIAAPAFDLSGLQLAGDYNKSNVLVAATLAEAAGVPHGDIQRVIPTLKPRWGRLEKVANHDCAADVYVDFAHTPDGIEKVLRAARAFTPAGGRLWIVFGAGGDRDPMKRPLMGEAAAKFADRIVVTSDNPRSEDPEAIMAAVMEGVRRVRPDAEGVAAAADRREAIGRAMAEASRGDVVLVCGKGHETTQEIAGVKHPFDDRRVVREWRA